MTAGESRPSSVAIASLAIDADHGPVQVRDALIDTGGSKNLASRHLLTNIKLAKSYGNEPIRMVTVNGISPDYSHQGELHTTDENGNPLVILCYVQEKPIMGHDTFVLLCNNTIVECDIDINYHAKTSKEVGAAPLKRLKSTPFHYTDATSATSNSNVTHSLEKPDFDFSKLALDASFQAKVLHLQSTGKRVRRRSKRPHPQRPPQDLFSLGSEWDPAFMSEIALQGLLDRTKADEQDEEAMDMTVSNGVRMSKYDIRALRVGLKVTPEMRDDLTKFNKDFVGEHSVFPVKNGAPRILEQFKDNPYTLELLDQYTTGNKPKKLPTAGATYYQGKPATRKVLEHFVRTTPVVEKCDDPRCFSRLVIVPKRDPGTPKDSPPTSYRVTMDALVNNCLKPVASTLPLATDEIKKLHGKRYFLKLDAMHAFWAIPLDEESKKLMAFQTHEGVFAWSRLTMGCRPASQIQQTAYHNAMDAHMPAKYRHCIAMFADDMAAGADTLEELFEIYKALVMALDKAGIQVKASKVEFGVEEITFHNYRIIGGDGPMANTTTPKDETLDPIRHCTIPQSVTQLKAFLGSTQQMAYYVPYYALAAAPLHRLTRKGEIFPSGSKWIPGSDYDMAFHHVRSLVLDRPLYIWNKDNSKHLFLEVDSSDEGWGACAYQYADRAPEGEDEGKHFLLSKRPKRIIQWISKAWTPYEKKSLPIFYKETIARILSLEQFRNLIETQGPGSGTTCYSDHLPGIKSTSLSNKGKLSTWKLHETSDLTSIVTTLYKSGPTMAIADPLSRLSRQEHRVDNLDLPLLLEMLLTELPDEIRDLEHFRVNAEKDTNVVTRIVQQWRTRSNPISNTVGGSGSAEFLISAPYADKLPLKVAEYIRQDVPFAILVPLSLLNEIDRVGKEQIDEAVRDKRARMKLVISTSLGQAWLINHPSCNLAVATHSVFFTETTDEESLQTAPSTLFSAWYMENVTSKGNTTFSCPKVLTSHDLEELVVGAIDRLMTGGMSQENDSFALITPREERAQKRAKRTLPIDQSVGWDSINAIPIDQSVSWDSTKAIPSHQSQTSDNEIEDDIVSLDKEHEVCQRTIKHPLHTIATGPPPLPIAEWPRLQDPQDIPPTMVRVPKQEIKGGMPLDLIILRDKRGKQRILVPKSQRIPLTQTEHETMLHVKGARVLHELSRSYFWPKMAEEIKQLCTACKVCQHAQIQRQNLSSVFRQAAEKDMPLPRQAYGIDFYGHEKGEILVAVDLCTREATLWFLPNRKQEHVARALMTGLILQKGVPLTFRNDEASEFVKGVVASMNRYLGISQVTTASYNPRSNAVVERFMQHLNGCLTKCDDTQYNNMQDYLPAIAFAHNTAFNSAINCTPFEAGHGLQARTITEARAGPRLQITAEGGMDLLESDKNWEKSIFPKVLKLAERLATEAQRHSQWHKRMNSHNLNQSGAKVEEKGLSPGDRVYFYRPPTQQEIARRGRKAKHLAHYHGPAIVQGNVEGRDRQYHIAYDGKQFKRDISMLIPERTIQSIDVIHYDPTAVTSPHIEPALLKPGVTLQEEELILCKTEKGDQAWSLAEVHKVYPEEIEVTYYTTPRQQLDDYKSATPEQRQRHLSQCRFRKTWFIRSGTNAGKGTLKAPFPKNPLLRLWTGKLPTNEFDDLILATGIKLDVNGYLTKESRIIASQVVIPHEAINTVEDERETLAKLQGSNAMFTYAEQQACNCRRCRRIWTETAREGNDVTPSTT